MTSLSFIAVRLTFPRFWAKVNFNGPWSEKCQSRCWEWKGSVVRSPNRPDNQYGNFKVGGKSLRAHRVAYELVNDVTLPAGHEVEVHHKCETKLCVNPAHLEILSRLEHNQRHIRTHCKRGHELVGANLRISPDRGRLCRKCIRESNRRHYYRQKGRHVTR